MIYILLVLKITFYIINFVISLEANAASEFDKGCVYDVSLKWHNLLSSVNQQPTVFVTKESLVYLYHFLLKHTFFSLKAFDISLQFSC